MKKIIASTVLAASLFIPMLTMAATTGTGGNLNCIAWTTDMPAGATTYNGQAVCPFGSESEDTISRLYTLEATVDAQTAEIATLESEVATLEGNQSAQNDTGTAVVPVQAQSIASAVPVAPTASVAPTTATTTPFTPTFNVPGYSQPMGEAQFLKLIGMVKSL